MRKSPKRLKVFLALCIVAAVSVHWPIITAAKAADDQRAAGMIDSNSVSILNRVPAFSLVDQRGAEITSDDLYGHVWIANLMFTRCKDGCGVELEVMQALQVSLRETDDWENLKLISISVDPDNDTSEVLADYISENNLDTAQWHFLTGAQDAIRRLREGGLKPPKGGETKSVDVPLMASDQIVLVDWEGQIRGYYSSLSDEDLRILKRDIARVAFERVNVPPGVEETDWVDGRMQNQVRLAKQYGVFSSFKFTDATSNSGITFHHRAVDDAAAEYKAVHYDHGNAIAVADVDLDGLYDIYFTSQGGSSELWRNLGNGRFENITTAAGLKVDDRIAVAASFADIDNDGDPDLYLTSVRIGNLLFENDGNGQFTNITSRSGAGLKAHSSGAVFFDYDRDGLLDLFVANVGRYTTDTLARVTLYTEKGQVSSDYQYYVGMKDAFAGHLKPERTEYSVLLKNLGDNRFKDVSEEVGLVDSSWTGDAAVIDGNSDGWPDLYVLNMQGDDQYYENVRGERFIRRSRELFPKTPWGSMGIKAFDYDNDGDMDIYVTDMHSDMAANISVSDEKLKMTTQYPESFLRTGGNSLFGNAFYRNDGNGQFSEISDDIGAENYWPWGLSSGDLNADGFEDVFIASAMNYPFRYGVNSLLLNNSGEGFLDSEYVLGVEPRKGGATAAPLFELMCSVRDKDHRLCGSSRGRRVVWGALGSRSSVIFDLDADGDLDIVTLEMSQPPMVLISNLSDKKTINYINVVLVGSESNRSGIGAKVAVYAGNDTYTKMQDGKSGYLSQSQLPLYFGLGDNTMIDKIEVTWPSGRTQVIERDIVLNRLLRITESAQ